MRMAVRFTWDGFSNKAYAIAKAENYVGSLAAAILAAWNALPAISGN
jgi:hypothetical protein